MSQAHRCGVVALLGRPNAGKSTLLNALVGEKIAIATAFAQTTRGRLLGVVSRDNAQLLIYDTPGVHRGQARFNLAMTETALSVAHDADIRLILFDAGATWDEPEARLAALRGPKILLRTKIDGGPATPIPKGAFDGPVMELSAKTGVGLDALFAAIIAELPESPALYDADTLTDAPLRFLAAEGIREVAFERLRDEVPYSLAVEVETWDESESELLIHANLLLERESQKGIVVGSRGQMLKGIGMEARKRLSELVHKTVHLKLWVKLDKNWTKRPNRARELGYL